MMSNKILKEGFSNWLDKQFNFDAGDMSQQGTITLANIKMTPDGGDEPIEYKTLTQFQVWSNPDNTVFKLKDVNGIDKGSDRASNPYTTVSSNAGRTFTLTKDQYEKLLMFPKQPQAPAMGV